MKDIFIFQKSSNHNLRSGIHLASRIKRTTLFGTENVSDLGAKYGLYCQNLAPTAKNRFILANSQK